MPITRDRVNAATQKMTLRFEDEADTLSIWFKPNRVTTQWQRAIKRGDRDFARRAAERERRREELLAAGEELPDDLTDEGDEAFEYEQQKHQVQLLLEVITDWDMLERMPTEDEPNPPKVPVDFDALDGLGIATIRRIAAEIGASITVDPTTSTSTGGGSPARAMTVISRNGSRT